MLDFIAQPMGWLLGQLYLFTSNYGISIIAFTLIIKLALMPLMVSQQRSQRGMQAIQPKIQELNKKYKNDREKLSQETMKLYQEHNINPLAGCLPMLIQMPIIFALFGVLREPIKFVFGGSESLALEATSNPFLWITDFSQPDTLATIINVDWAAMIPGILPILAAILTYLQFATMRQPQAQDGNEMASQMTKTMRIFMPAVILFSGMSLAAGIALYWVVSMGFQIVQQMIMNRDMENAK